MSLHQRSVRYVPGPDDPVPIRAEQDTLLTVEQVAARLNIGTSTVYRLCQRDKLPVVRLDGTAAIRVSRLRLEALVRERTVAPTADRSAARDAMGD